MTEPRPTDADAPRRATWRSPWRQALVLAGLTGFAISQPLLGLLGDNPTTLTFHGVEGVQVVQLALLVALGPPLALWLATMAARRANGTVGDVLHLVVVAGLATAALIPLLKAIGLPGPGLVLLAGLALGVGFAVLYARVQAAATWASYTAILPVMAVTSFVLLSPASSLLQTADAPEREDVGAPSVVFILLDELPTRSLLDTEAGIDAARYPNLAGFASEATWYRRHTTLASVTAVAVPSMLTGRDPKPGLPLWTEHPDNLFTLLAPTHDLDVIETATNLCPYDVCAPTPAEGEDVLPTGPGFGDLLGVTRDIWVERASPREAEASTLDDFNETLVDLDPEEADGPAPAVTTPTPNAPREGFFPTDESMIASSRSVNTMMSAFDASKGSTLYYLHLMFPHQPWRFFPDGTLYTDVDESGFTLDRELGPIRASWNEWDAAVSETRHLLQMEYTDRLLGQLFEALQQQGLYDDSLIVIAADHGVSFNLETPMREITAETIDAVAYTPLLIKEPGQRAGRVDDSNVLSTDILPTIADVLGIELPEPVDGAVLGSDAIQQRGSAKQVYDVRGLGNVTFHGTVDFDDDETFARLTDRWVSADSPPGDPTASLAPHLGLDDVVGRRLDDFSPEPGGSIDLFADDELRRPAGRAPIGISLGVIENAPEGSRAVLAVNGVIVAGSPITEDLSGRGRITFFLPQGTLGDQNEIAVALVLADGTFELLDIA